MLSVKVGNGKSFKVSLASVNKLAFTDIVTCSKKMLHQKNLKQSRFRKNNREIRDRNRKERIFNSINASSNEDENGSDEMLQHSIYLLSMHQTRSEKRQRIS